MAKHASDLTRQQLEALEKIVGRHLGFYTRLAKRLDQLRFDPTEPLYQKSLVAHSATQALRMELHYLTCAPDSVGRE